MNEVSGWDLEDEDITLVNSESDGNRLYLVKLWWGSGYQMDCYNAYAFSDEEALNYVVAYIEKNDPEMLEATDECAKNLLNEIEQDHISATEMGYDDDFYPEDTPEFQEAFLWVDATMEGAKKAHYVWAENLQIAEYPKEHDYPMSKDVKRMNESDALGKRKPRKPKDVIVKVDVEWTGMDSEDDDEQYLDDVGLPGSVYINMPWESYADGELDYDLRTKLGNTFDGYVEDYTYHRVEPRAVPKGVPIYLWSPETDIMEEF